MSTVLNPSHATIATIRTSIQSTLKAELPPDVLANAIAPLLTTVNQWSSQIPTLLEGPGPPLSANLVFAIRKDLFIAPLFSQSVMGITLVDLPTPFQEFMTFIHKLIEAQKTEREKPVAKVCLLFVLSAESISTSFPFIIQPKRISRIKSKQFVEDDEPVDSLSTSVSEPVVEGVNNSIDDSVCLSIAC